VSDYFTAEEIAHLKGCSVSYVRNLACHHGWRRMGTRPQRYHIVDVMKTLGPAKGLRM
jgi:hypothetical protein